MSLARNRRRLCPPAIIASSSTFPLPLDLLFGRQPWRQSSPCATHGGMNGRSIEVSMLGFPRIWMEYAACCLHVATPTCSSSTMRNRATVEARHMLPHVSSPAVLRHHPAHLASAERGSTGFSTSIPSARAQRGAGSRARSASADRGSSARAR